MDRMLLFDLDETLVVEEPAAVAAFEATAQVAATHHDVDVPALAVAARSRARELWRAAPTHPYCLRIGISSWEGLWCRFEADNADARRLRDWSPTYRREAWRLQLRWPLELSPRPLADGLLVAGGDGDLHRYRR